LSEIGCHGTCYEINYLIAKVYDHHAFDAHFPDQKVFISWSFFHGIIKTVQFPSILFNLDFLYLDI